VRTYPRATPPIVHVDVYRLERLHDVLDLGDEVFADDVVTFVEWGDAIAPLLPDDRLDVEVLLAAEDAGRRPVVVLRGRSARRASDERGTISRAGSIRGTARRCHERSPLMLVLGIETSTARSSVALVDATTGGRVREPRRGSAPRRVRRARDRLLPGAGRRRRGRLTGVAVGLGPGLFTGLRVGIATAQAIAPRCKACRWWAQQPRRARLPGALRAPADLLGHRRRRKRAVLGVLPVGARRGAARGGPEDRLARRCPPRSARRRGRAGRSATAR
jgi:hypothetical protein